MKIALVGNPNAGKTSLFNALTGMNQKVGNFPGVTVDRKQGTLNLDSKTPATIIDLPGIYTLYPKSQDEQIACEIIRNPKHPDHADCWVIVADITQPRRSLLLCTQLIDLQLPVILVLNMIDMLNDSDPNIDHYSLSQQLGIPVLKISARKGTGIENLKKTLTTIPTISPIRFLKIPEGLATTIQQIQTTFPNKNDYLSYQIHVDLEGFKPYLTPKIYDQLSKTCHTSPALIANEIVVRYDRIDHILEKAHKPATTFAEKQTDYIDSILLHPIGGYAIFVGILFLIFFCLFWVAQTPMTYIENLFSYTSDLIADTSYIPDGWFKQFLVQGLLAGISGIVVFIPQIAFLFFFISILEETGYMSRVIFLMDKIMRPFGISGRSVIPLIGGMACAVPSIMMARTIPHPRERLITILVTPLMSCSARLPVYILLIGLFVPTNTIFGNLLQPIVLMFLYILGFLSALTVAIIFKWTFNYKSDGIFVTEMPLYRIPRWKNVAITIWEKCRAFLTEAGKIIVLITIILWALSSFSPDKSFNNIEKNYTNQIQTATLNNDTTALDSIKLTIASEKLKKSYAGAIGKTIEPVIRPLGFDWKIGIALISSFAAREVFTGTMGIIYGMDSDLDIITDKKGRRTLTQRISKEYSTATAISLILFYAFAMQCISTLAITKRETNSWKWTIIMLTYMTALAYLISLITYQILK